MANFAIIQINCDHLEELNNPDFGAMLASAVRHNDGWYLQDFSRCVRIVGNIGEPLQGVTDMDLYELAKRRFARHEQFEGAQLDPRQMFVEHVRTYGLQMQRYWLDGTRRPDDAPDYLPDLVNY